VLRVSLDGNMEGMVVRKIIESQSDDENGRIIGIFVSYIFAIYETGSMI
jgi:hypothetical protein